MLTKKYTLFFNNILHILYHPTHHSHFFFGLRSSALLFLPANSFKNIFREHTPLNTFIRFYFYSTPPPHTPTGGVRREDQLFASQVFLKKFCKHPARLSINIYFCFFFGCPGRRRTFLAGNPFLENFFVGGWGGVFYIQGRLYSLILLNKPDKLSLRNKITSPLFRYSYSKTIETPSTN